MKTFSFQASFWFAVKNCLSYILYENWLEFVKKLHLLGSDYYQKLSHNLRQKRDKLCNALSAGGLRPYTPQGGFFVLADLSKIPGKNSHDRAMNLLQQAGVACVPGEAFYHDGSGKNMGRFCFAKKDTQLDDACRRIEKL